MDWIVVGVVLVMGLMLAPFTIDEEPRHDQTSDDDRDRPGEREEHWYALDEPMIIEKNRSKAH
jgi:hypothetical protein